MVYLTSLPHNHLHSFILSWSRVNFIHLTSIFLLCAHSKYPQRANTLTHSPKTICVPKWVPKTLLFKFPKCLLIILQHWVLKVLLNALSFVLRHWPPYQPGYRVPFPCPLVSSPNHNNYRIAHIPFLLSFSIESFTHIIYVQPCVGNTIH